MTVILKKETLQDYGYSLQVIHFHPGNSSKKEREGKYYLTKAVILSTPSDKKQDPVVVSCGYFCTKRTVKAQRKLRYSIAVGRCLKHFQDFIGVSKTLDMAFGIIESTPIKIGSSIKINSI
jgi:hypothetical protein